MPHLPQQPVLSEQPQQECRVLARLEEVRGQVDELMNEAARLDQSLDPYLRPNIPGETRDQAAGPEIDGPVSEVLRRIECISETVACIRLRIQDIRDRIE